MFNTQKRFQQNSIFNTSNLVVLNYLLVCVCVCVCVCVDSSPISRAKYNKNQLFTKEKPANFSLFFRRKLYNNISI